MNPGNFAVKWSLGRPGDAGFECLRLSIWGAWSLLGPDCRYIVCCAGSNPSEALQRTGRLPDFINFTDVAPRATGRYEILLDNECILWNLPPSLMNWIDQGHPTRRLLGQNPGFQVLPPGFHPEALRDVDPFVVGLDEISVCSPQATSLGSCGAHFIGLDLRQDHWLRHRRDVIQRVWAAESPWTFQEEKQRLAA
jgi:hypothetical protein